MDREQKMEAAIRRALAYLIGCPGEDTTEIAEQLREALKNG